MAVRYICALAVVPASVCIIKRKNLPIGIGCPMSKNQCILITSPDRETHEIRIRLRTQPTNHGGTHV